MQASDESYLIIQNASHVQNASRVVLHTPEITLLEDDGVGFISTNSDYAQICPNLKDTARVQQRNLEKVGIFC